MEVMYVKKLNNSYLKNKEIVGLVGEFSDLQTLVNNAEYIEYKINSKVKKHLIKVKDVLEIFSLNEISNKKIRDLSSVEIKILSLIKAINLNPELIILNNFEIGINEKYLNNIIRFVKNINSERKIKILVVSNNVMYLNKLVKNVIIMKNNIIKYQGDLLVAIESKLLPKPEIIKFIDLVNINSHKLDYTLDEKELLKDIYRSV